LISDTASMNKGDLTLEPDRFPFGCFTKQLDKSSAYQANYYCLRADFAEAPEVQAANLNLHCFELILVMPQTYKLLSALSDNSGSSAIFPRF